LWRRASAAGAGPSKYGARLVHEQLAAVMPHSALDEPRRQNHDLISALEDLKKQKEQLLLLNSELQETNHGVMALYSELSEELEQTNRGVVALYAELDQTSERLRTASESKDRFWANVSHELRTPLNSIIGLTRLLADLAGDGELNPEQLYQVELIKNSGSVLLALVNDLLDVAKAEFYQVPGLRRGGTGLGLPYARRLARILGGDLELISEVGAGTTVVLSLPHGTPALGTVVLADDDAGFRQILRGMLIPMADRVMEAADGSEALAILAGNPVDLILADMRMPGLDGGALLARLPASVPAIIVTGADVPRPPRAAALLRKDELTRERLEFTIRGVMRGAR
jgi:CheY-like chemotaxis protein